MLPNVGKYVMAVFFLILVYLLVTQYKGFNSVISALGDVSVKGITVLQGR